VASEIVVRDALPADWPGVWQVLEPVLRAGETYTYPRDIDEAAAREAWTATPGSRVLVALDDGAAVEKAK
jgi:hypothetical protein